MKNKKLNISLIMEKFLMKEAQIFEPTKDSANGFGQLLKQSIKIPYVNFSVSSLGKLDTVYAVFGLQSKEDWPNGIFENSKYFRMSITSSGVMEVISHGLVQKSKSPYMAYDSIPVKFRKSTAKNAADAIAKINDFIGKVKKHYESIGTTIN